MRTHGTGLKLNITAVHLEISLSSQFFFLQFETAERNAQGAQYFAGWHKWGLSIELLRAQWVPWSVALVASFIDNGYKQINSTWNIHIVKEFLWGHIKKIMNSLSSFAVLSNMVEKETFLWNILTCKSHSFLFSFNDNKFFKNTLVTHICSCKQTLPI